jgi:predicted  nucleic acid-binding Zn-ribbon protein
MVCLNCRESFSTGRDFHLKSCPKCGDPYILYNEKFKPPKKDDLKTWKTIIFLRDHGFNYQHVYKDLTIKQWDSRENMVEYPTTLAEAKDFVEIYKSQAKILTK